MEHVIATGRRKTAVARVILEPGDGSIVINGKDYKDYFPQFLFQQDVEAPLKVTEEQRQGTYRVRVRVTGGGPRGQAQAVRHGIARALERVEPDLRDLLKTHGFLTRDPRMVERKKYGQHKARKQYQFRKR